MKKLRLIFLVALASVRLFAAESSVGKPVFNGTNLNDWTQMNGGNFFVTNGVIRAEGGKGWLRTERAYTNFICEVEWRGLETNYNSGVFLRAPLEGNPWATNIWQINTKQSAIGELLEGSKKAVPSAIAARPVGEWVKFRIEARGRELSLDVDGERAWKISDFSPRSGYIGLQAEGKTFEFRNLTVHLLAD